jgi:hypothetical protein
MAGAYGRNDGSNGVQALYKETTFADGQSAVITVGRLPKNHLVLSAGVAVITAFNDATDKLGDLGTTGDPDGWGTDLSLATIGNIVQDEIATSNDYTSTDETDVLFTHARTGTAATAGRAIIYCTYIVLTN